MSNFRQTKIIIIIVLIIAAIPFICLFGGAFILDFYTQNRDAKEKQRKTEEAESRPKTFELMRLNPNGSFDSTFGSNGALTIDSTVAPSAKTSYFQYLFVQKNGKMLVEYGNQFRRFSENGMLENDSKINGELIFERNNQDLVEIGGYSKSFETDEGESYRRSFIEIRTKNSEGILNRNFGENGIVKTNYRMNFGDTFAAALSTDGKILVAGDEPGLDLTIARYTETGSLDESFGKRGKIELKRKFFKPAILQIITQKEGKFIFVIQENTIVLLAFNTDGTIDTKFAKDGELTTDIQSNNSRNTVVTDAVGNLLAGGRVNNNYVIRRYKENGVIDSTFNNGEQLVVEAVKLPEKYYRDDIWQNLSLQSDGKILAAFHRPCLINCIHEYKLDSTFGIKRLNKDGTTDTTFGNQGSLSFDGYIGELISLSNQKFLVAGRIVGLKNH